MTLKLIAAVANNRVIGNQQQLPWQLPNDLRYFRQATQGKTVVMGRNTYESIGRALPKRHNIVCTRNPKYCLDDAEVTNQFSERIKQNNPNEGSSDYLIIGGEQLYRAALPLADELLLTLVDAEPEGDTWFPEWRESGEWEMTWEEAHRADDKNQHDYVFTRWQRI